MREHTSGPSLLRVLSQARGRTALVVMLAFVAVTFGSWVPSERTVAVPTQQAAAVSKIAPSGKAMPKGNVKGWKKIFSDNFTGKKLKKPWSKYSGQPGGNPGGYWKPSHAVVEKGMLRLKTYKDNGRWTSGGVGTWNGLAMKYGRIDVRFRAPKAKGVSYALLLWPQSGGWPPEIDFAEDGGGNRRSTAATFHHGANNSQIQRKKSANFAKWHTVGVRWSPSKIVYTLDGKAWATVKHKAVPNEKMVLALQSHTMSCGIPWAVCPGRTTPKKSSIDIDWVVAYKKA